MFWWTLLQLKSRNPETRAKAAEKLGKSKNPRATKYLIPLLKDENWRVQHKATFALGFIKDTQAVEPLIAELRNGSSSATIVLGWFRDPRAVEPLIEILGDESRGQEAAKSLEALLKYIEPEHFEQNPLGDQAIQSLIKASKSQDTSVKQTARQVSKYLGAFGVEVLLPSYVEDLKHSLKNKGRGFVRSDDSKREVRKAIESLTELGDPRAIDYLKIALTDQSHEVCQAAANGLVSLGWQPKAKEEQILLALMSGGKTEIGPLTTDDVKPILTMVRGYNEQHDDYRVALRAIQQIGAPAVEPLLDVVQESGLYDTPWTLAITALGRIADPRAIQPLTALLNDKNSAKREYVKRTLRILGWQPTDSEQRVLFAAASGNWTEAASIGPTAVGPLLSALSRQKAPESAKTLLNQVDPNWRKSDLAKRGILKNLEEIIHHSPNVLELIEVIVDMGGEVVQALFDQLDALSRKGFEENRLFIGRFIDILSKLGECREHRAVELLAALLKHKGLSDETLGNVVRALGHTNDERAVLPLVDFAVASRGQEKEIGRRTLPEEAILALENTLRNTIRKVPSEALRAVANLGGIYYSERVFDDNPMDQTGHLESVTVNCTQVKLLAQEELEKR